MTKTTYVFRNGALVEKPQALPTIPFISTPSSDFFNRFRDAYFEQLRLAYGEIDRFRELYQQDWLSEPPLLAEPAEHRPEEPAPRRPLFGPRGRRSL